MGRKVRDGNSVRVTVPQSTTVEQGDFVLLDGFFGMAVQAAETGVGETADIILNTEQSVYETSQIDTGDAFALGDPVYFDAVAKVLTTDPDADADGFPQNRLVGRVYAAKDANDVIELLLLPQGESAQAA